MLIASVFESGLNRALLWTPCPLAPCLLSSHQLCHPDKRAAVLFEPTQRFLKLYYHNIQGVCLEQRRCFLQHVAFMCDSRFLGFSLKCLLLDCFTRWLSLMSVSCMTVIEQRRRSGDNEKEKSHLSSDFCFELCNPHSLRTLTAPPLHPSILSPTHTKTPV